MEQRKIEHLIVDIDSVETHPKNVRQGDIGAISESLKAHGQYRPIVVDKRTNRILAGNHTWKAAKALGWSQISAGFVETKDDDEALRILLADNRTTDLASYDDDGLSELLKQLAETDVGLDGTLFDGDDLDSLLADKASDQQGNFLSLNEKYEVVIECKDENQQSELLERLYNEGLKVRALTI
jgi:ParB-like chromosome segregation protein Spo0J